MNDDIAASAVTVSKSLTELSEIEGQAKASKELELNSILIPAA